MYAFVTCYFYIYITKKKLFIYIFIIKLCLILNASMRLHGLHASLFSLKV